MFRFILHHVRRPHLRLGMMSPYEIPPESDVQKGKKMIARVRAKFTNGRIIPLERLDIEEGAEVMIVIENIPRASEGLASIVAKVKELQQEIPPDAWDDLPTDLAKNKKHYLYGHPKETD